MKTLIEMKKVYCFNRFVLFVMVLSLATTFTSCSNETMRIFLYILLKT